MVELQSVDWTSDNQSNFHIRKTSPIRSRCLDFWLFFGTRVLWTFCFASSKHELWVRWQGRPPLRHQSSTGWFTHPIINPRSSSWDGLFLWSYQCNTSQSTKGCRADSHWASTIGSSQQWKQEIEKKNFTCLPMCLLQIIGHHSRCKKESWTHHNLCTAQWCLYTWNRRKSCWLRRVTCERLLCLSSSFPVRLSKQEAPSPNGH